MKLLKLVPSATNIDFVKWKNFAFIGSAAAIVFSIFVFFAWGLNYGIDFRGGTLMTIKTEQAADIAAVRSIVGDLDLGDVQIQEFGSANEVLIRIEEQVGDQSVERDPVERAELQKQIPSKIRAALDSNYPEPYTVGLTEMVGPKVSGELVNTGIKAVIGAIILMLGYIFIQFDWQFSVGAVIALTHDVILTIGIFSLLQIEFNLSIIAAILTIVGYSMNDTVVVYDRVRENLRKYKKRDLSEVLNLSINETLARTTMTSVTTLLALVSLYVFGGAVIKGFTFAMIWGVVIGTYSSIFVAAPVLLILGVKRDWSNVDSNATAHV
jgi:preprotein translocase subunit SecF